jgi:hypothetical protein
LFTFVKHLNAADAVLRSPACLRQRTKPAWLFQLVRARIDREFESPERRRPDTGAPISVLAMCPSEPPGISLTIREPPGRASGDIRSSPARIFPGLCFRILQLTFGTSDEAATMTKTIEALRKVADECQERANRTSDGALKAELVELTTQWHWLAGRAAELCGKTEELEEV